MILGFTGTRQGMTEAQYFWFAEDFPRINPDLFLHGGAEGADEQADNIAGSFLPGLSIEVYPIKVRERFWLENAYRKVHPPSPPLLRNRIIASRCTHLIACPATAEEQLRSGTWATVRYAHAAGKPVTIITPDGRAMPYGARPHGERL